MMNKISFTFLSSNTPRDLQYSFEKLFHSGQPLRDDLENLKKYFLNRNNKIKRISKRNEKAAKNSISYGIKNVVSIS